MFKKITTIALLLLLLHGGLAMALELTSESFEHNAVIPQKYTCDGQDISPQLKWDNVPEGTRAFAMICDDPDAPMGTWDHWIVFNIPVDTTEFPEDIRLLPDGTKEGNNSWNRTGYGGPCPPDREHRYMFKLYALDTVLELDDGASKSELEAVMKGHILAQAELIGRYNRPQNQ